MESQFLTAENQFQKNTALLTSPLQRDDLSNASWSQTLCLNVQSGVCTSAWVMWFCCPLFSFFGTQKSSAVPGFGIAPLKRKRRRKKKSNKTSALFENQKQMFRVFGRRSNWYVVSRVLGFEEVKRRQPRARLHAGCRLK